MANYNKQNIVDALKKLGIKKGDNVFVHSNLGFFGILDGANSAKDYYLAFKNAFLDTIGKNGTLIVPTFSYSFCKKQNFDIKNTPSVCGMFSEEIRKSTEAIRSNDANFSIAAIGNLAKFYTTNSTEHSFGKDSFWDRFYKTKGIICNLNFDSGSTFIHYVEKQLNVSYRYDKKFSGIIINNEKQEKRNFYHFVYDLNKPNHCANFTQFDKIAKNKNIAKVINLGKGQILKISTKDTYDLILNEIKNCPNFLIEGDI